MIPLGGYVQMLESKNADGETNDIKDSDYEFCLIKRMFIKDLQSLLQDQYLICY